MADLIIPDEDIERVQEAAQPFNGVLDGIKKTYSAILDENSDNMEALQGAMDSFIEMIAAFIEMIKNFFANLLGLSNEEEENEKKQEEREMEVMPSSAPSNANPPQFSQPVAPPLTFPQPAVMPYQASAQFNQPVAPPPKPQVNQTFVPQTEVQRPSSPPPAVRQSAQTAQFSSTAKSNNSPSSSSKPTQEARQSFANTNNSASRVSTATKTPPAKEVSKPTNSVPEQKKVNPETKQAAPKVATTNTAPKEIKSPIQGKPTTAATKPVTSPPQKPTAVEKEKPTATVSVAANPATVSPAKIQAEVEQTKVEPPKIKSSLKNTSAVDKNAPKKTVRFAELPEKETKPTNVASAAPATVSSTKAQAKVNPPQAQQGVTPTNKTQQPPQEKKSLWGSFKSALGFGKSADTEVNKTPVQAAVNKPKAVETPPPLPLAKGDLNKEEVSYNKVYGYTTLDVNEQTGQKIMSGFKSYLEQQQSVPVTSGNIVERTIHDGVEKSPYVGLNNSMMVATTDHRGTSFKIHEKGGNGAERGPGVHDSARLSQEFTNYQKKPEFQEIIKSGKSQANDNQTKTAINENASAAVTKMPETKAPETKAPETKAAPLMTQANDTQSKTSAKESVASAIKMPEIKQEPKPTPSPAAKPDSPSPVKSS